MEFGLELLLPGEQVFKQGCSEKINKHSDLKSSTDLKPDIKINNWDVQMQFCQCLPPII